MSVVGKDALLDEPDLVAAEVGLLQVFHLNQFFLAPTSVNISLEINCSTNDPLSDKPVILLVRYYLKC